MRKALIMLKLISLVVSFLIEMIFGKKPTDAPEDALLSTGRWKKIFVSGIITISFIVNYLAIGRLYSLSVSYIDLNNQKLAYKAKLEILDNTKARSEQLEKSLEYCMNSTLAIQQARDAKVVTSVSPKDKK